MYRVWIARKHHGIASDGQAWLRVWDVNPSLDLYSADGYHPAPLGTYLAALVIVECVTHRDPRTFPATAFVGSATITADTTTVRMLQRVAHETNVAYHGCGV